MNRKIASDCRMLERAMKSLLIKAREQSGFSEQQIAQMAQIHRADIAWIEKSPSQVPCHLLHSLVVVYGQEFSCKFNGVVHDALTKTQVTRTNSDVSASVQEASVIPMAGSEVSAESIAKKPVSLQIVSNR